MHSSTVLYKAIVVAIWYNWVDIVSCGQGVPSASRSFVAARGAGDEVMIPLCEAHFCKGTGSNPNGTLPATEWRVCSCDKDCYRRRDCCLDAFSEEEFPAVMDGDVWACVNTPRGRGPYSVIGRCPLNWTGDAAVKRKCETSLTPGSNEMRDPNLVLAITSTLTNVTYKNTFCAHCHEKSSGTNQFQLKFKCTGKNVSDVLQGLREKECDVHLDQLNLDVCSQMESTVSSCPSDWSHPNATYAREIAWRCSTYFAPITVKVGRYKNIFCAVCSKVGPISIGDIVCRNSYYPIEQEFILELEGDFRSGGKIPGNGKETCKSGFIWDPFRKECRKLMECFNPLEGCNSTSHNISKRDTNETVTSSPSPSSSSTTSSADSNVKPPGGGSIMCNMSLLSNDSFSIDNKTMALSLNSNPSLTYLKGEYELVNNKNVTGALVCSKEPSPAIDFRRFPQHFCSRRNILGYGSCSCEPDCVQTRSCCMDALNATTVSTLSETEDSWLCINDSRNSSALAKCHANWSNSEVRDFCERPAALDQDPFLHVPAFSWETSTLYRNAYCAVCNGAYNITFHNIHFLCGEHAKLRNGWEAAEKFAKTPGLCSLQTEPGNPDLPLRFCLQDPRCRSCSNPKLDSAPTDKSLLWRCNHYYAPIEIHGTCFRNDFCATCSGELTSDTFPLRSNFIGQGLSFRDHEGDPDVLFTTFMVG